MLSDNLIRSMSKCPIILEKLRINFQAWLNGERLPDYMLQARTVLLSKEIDDSPFVQAGNLRVICILPAITKLNDTVLHNKLLLEIESKAPLHENQRGFRKGTSTLNNLADVFELIESVGVLFEV